MKGCGTKIGPFDCCTCVCGKVEELLPQVPPQSVDAVITDPPYGVDAESWDGKVPYSLLGDFLKISRGPVLWFGAAPRVAEAYAEFFPPPDRLLIWAPNFTLSHTGTNGMSFRYHPVYAWGLPKKQEGTAWDVLTDNTETGNWWKHSCTKPVALMEKLCGIVPAGSNILDPFAGSGTTLVAAKNRGQHFLGFEMNADHCAVANNRLAGTVVSRDGLWKQTNFFSEENI